MKPVRMYTTQVCPFCIRAKALLQASAAWRRSTKCASISTRRTRLRMMQLTGRRTVPQIFIGDTHVGGCDELMALDQRGGLMPLLAELNAACSPGRR